MAESKSLRRAIQDSDCRSVDVCSREQTRILKYVMLLHESWSDRGSRSVTDAFTKALCDKRIVAEDFKVWIGEMKAISSKKENRRILIVGEAGDGKSTLLNTLLAQSVLRTGCAGSSETSNICEISYTGSSRSIVLDKFYVKETEWRDLMMSLDDARDIEIPDTEQNDQSTPAEELQDEWLRLKTLFYG